MTRRILAILVAIALAVFGTGAVLLYVKRADDRAVANASPVDVLVARARIPAGTTGESIRTKNLAEVIRLPAGSVPADEVMTRVPEDLSKLVVTSDLQPGQVVLRRMFSQQTRTAGGLAIPEGRMAVSFEASMAEQVAGFVRPGSQVAVFVRFRLVGKVRELGDDGNGVKGTTVLLPRVEVIAIGPYGNGETTTTPSDGRDGQDDGDDAGDRTAVLVTVAATADEAAKIILAASSDALYLALLNDSSEIDEGLHGDLLFD